MAKRDVLPDGHQEFDTLQEIIVKAVTANAATWQIPVAEIAKLTAKQTIWNSSWAIAKDKQNSTTAQKKNRDIARGEYEKVLRPFIQKWIYLNENMDGADVEKCGLKPRDTNRTPVALPDAVTVKLTHGETREIIANCPVQKTAKYFGCIMTEGAPLPKNFTVSPDGKIKGLVKLLADTPAITDVQIDLTDKRKKYFAGLKPGSTYYFYFYVVNGSGVSALSAPVSMVCW